MRLKTPNLNRAPCCACRPNKLPVNTKVPCQATARLARCAALEVGAVARPGAGRRELFPGGAEQLRCAGRRPGPASPASSAPRRARRQARRPAAIGVDAASLELADVRLAARHLLQRLESWRLGRVRRVAQSLDGMRNPPGLRPMSLVGLTVATDNRQQRQPGARSQAPAARAGDEGWAISPPPSAAGPSGYARRCTRRST